MGNEKVRLVKNIINLTDSITRPNDTTPYTAGDAISNVTTNEGLVLTSPAGHTVEARSARLLGYKMWTNHTTGPALLVMLSSAAITNTADNSPAVTPDAEVRDEFITRIGVSSSIWEDAGGSMLAVSAGADDRFKIPLVGGAFTLYANLLADGAYTPIADQIFEVSLHLELY